MALALRLVLFAAPADAQTAAGTRIANTAGARWTVADAVESTRSNTDTLIVAERLDVTLTAGDVIEQAAKIVVPLTITNAGTHDEQFAVTASVTGAADATVVVFADSDGDGRFDAARDMPLGDGRTPMLMANGVAQVFAVVTPGQNGLGAGAKVVAETRAVTGSGAPGTVFAQAGDGGGDAIVGQTGATAQASVPLAPGKTDSGNALIKTQSVAAPDGSARAIPGAIVTYALAAHLAERSPGAEVADPLPSGTRYVPGSLRLDGAALSDAADGDAGEVVDGAVLVRLGDAAAAVVRTVLFQVQIL